MHPRRILEPNHMHRRHPQTRNIPTKTEVDERTAVSDPLLVRALHHFFDAGF